MTRQQLHMRENRHMILVSIPMVNPAAETAPSLVKALALALASVPPASGRWKNAR